MSQLMEDRRLMTDEHETYKARESEKYELLEQRLRKTQELLRDTTKDFLQASGTWALGQYKLCTKCKDQISYR